MNFEQRTAYQEGRRAAAGVVRISRRTGGGHFAPPHPELQITPELGCVFRALAEATEKAARLPPGARLDTGLVPEADIRTILGPDGVVDRQAAEQQAAALEARLLEEGVPRDDLLPDQPREGDEFFARGFLDEIAEQQSKPT